MLFKVPDIDVEVMSVVIPREGMTPVAPVGEIHLAGVGHADGVKGFDSFAGEDEVRVPHGPSSEQKLEPLRSTQGERGERVKAVSTASSRALRRASQEQDSTWQMWTMLRQVWSR